MFRPMGETLIELVAGAGPAGEGELVQEAAVAGRGTVAAGRMAECAGETGLVRAGGTGDQGGLAVRDPLSGGEAEDERAVEAAGSLDRGLRSWRRDAVVRRWRGALSGTAGPSPPPASEPGVRSARTALTGGIISPRARSTGSGTVDAVPKALRAPIQKLLDSTCSAPLRCAVRPVHAPTAPSLPPSVGPMPPRRFSLDTHSCVTEPENGILSGEWFNSVRTYGLRGGTTGSNPARWPAREELPIAPPPEESRLRTPA